MIRFLIFFMFVITFSWSLANTGAEEINVQSETEKEASCELVSRLAFLAVENFSKDVELDQVKDLLDPVLRSAVERLDTEAQKSLLRQNMRGLSLKLILQTIWLQSIMQKDTYLYATGFDYIFKD